MVDCLPVHLVQQGRSSQPCYLQEWRTTSAPGGNRERIPSWYFRSAETDIREPCQSSDRNGRSRPCTRTNTRARDSFQCTERRVWGPDRATGIPRTFPSSDRNGQV